MTSFEMKGIKLIIFDLDGTLVNAYRAIISSFNYAMQKLKLPTQGDLEILRAVGWGDENLLRPFVKQKDLYKAVQIYRKHHAVSILKDSHLFPKTKKVLSYLKNKSYKLAIASNRPIRFTQILIRHLKIDQYFAYVLCADKLKQIKPHPKILNKIMQKFRVKPHQTLYIGDMTIDVQAGRRAKIKTIIVTTGLSKKREIQKEKPYCIIKSITELLKIL